MQLINYEPRKNHKVMKASLMQANETQPNVSGASVAMEQKSTRLPRKLQDNNRSHQSMRRSFVCFHIGLNK